MASWEDGGGPIPMPCGDEAPYGLCGPCGPYIVGGTRRVSNSDGSDHHSDPGWPSTPVPVPCRRMWLVRAPYDHEHVSPPAEGAPLNGVPVFIRTCPSSPQSDLGGDVECGPEPSPEPDAGPWELVGAELGPVPIFHGPVLEVTAAVPMERTASGISISSSTTCHSFASPGYHGHQGYPDYSGPPGGTGSPGPPLLDDIEAALQIRDHLEAFSRHSRDSQHERILRTLINPKTRAAEFPIDDEALESIFSAANEIFFRGTLSQRVTWDWSHESARQYESQVIGTTALRRSAQLGGFETLIVLSQPILGRDGGYNRRLLISTFLHELIHSYMFVTCGFEARRYGGHTKGFRMIAEMMDAWAGPEYLHLKEMEADLERFREEPQELPLPEPPVGREMEWQRGVDDRTRGSTFNNNATDDEYRRQQSPSPSPDWYFSLSSHQHSHHDHHDHHEQHHSHSQSHLQSLSLSHSHSHSRTHSHQHQHQHDYHHHHHHLDQQSHYHHEYVREETYHSSYQRDEGEGKGKWDEWVGDRWHDERWVSVSSVSASASSVSMSASMPDRGGGEGESDTTAEWPASGPGRHLHRDMNATSSSPYVFYHHGGPS